MNIKLCNKDENRQEVGGYVMKVSFENKREPMKVKLGKSSSEYINDPLRAALIGLAVATPPAAVWRYHARKKRQKELEDILDAYKAANPRTIGAHRELGDEDVLGMLSMMRGPSNLHDAEVLSVKDASETGLVKESRDDSSYWDYLLKPIKMFIPKGEGKSTVGKHILNWGALLAALYGGKRLGGALADRRFDRSVNKFNEDAKSRYERALHAHQIVSNYSKATREGDSFKFANEKRGWIGNPFKGVSGIVDKGRGLMALGVLGALLGGWQLGRNRASQEDRSLPKYEAGLRELQRRHSNKAIRIPSWQVKKDKLSEKDKKILMEDLDKALLEVHGSLGDREEEDKGFISNVRNLLTA